MLFQGDFMDILKVAGVILGVVILLVGMNTAPRGGNGGKGGNNNSSSSSSNSSNSNNTPSNQ